MFKASNKEDKDDDFSGVPEDQMPNEPYNRYENPGIMEEEKANPANLDTSKLNRKKPEHFKSTIY